MTKERLNSQLDILQIDIAVGDYFDPARKLRRATAFLYRVVSNCRVGVRVDFILKIDDDVHVVEWTFECGLQTFSHRTAITRLKLFYGKSGL